MMPALNRREMGRHIVALIGSLGNLDALGPEVLHQMLMQGTLYRGVSFAEIGRFEVAVAGGQRRFNRM